MNRVQWGKKVTDELNKLAPDKQAIKGWVESQNFKVISLQEKPDGSWWFEAENKNMTFTILRVRWNVNEKRTLKVTVS
jgi:hypothetical protein